MNTFRFLSITALLFLVSSSLGASPNADHELGSQPSLSEDDNVIGDIHILLFESDPSLLDEDSPLSFFRDTGKKAGIKTTVYGEGSTYEGFGDKYLHLRPLLSKMDPDELVILSDSRDVLLNVPDKKYASEAILTFKAAYQRLTKGLPHAVVVSAEAQCCVSALSHAAPGDYFSMTGQRNKRACSSGEADCLYEDNENIVMWSSFMEGLALGKTGTHPDNVYLNAGLIVGHPRNILHLLDKICIEGTEDDQAVLSGLLYHDPTSIVLDYGQELFGNNQWPDELEEGCVYDANEDKVLVHRSFKTKPLIVHTSGKFFDCLERLVDEVGGSATIWSTKNIEAQGRNLEEYGVHGSDDYVPDAHLRSGYGNHLRRMENLDTEEHVRNLNYGRGRNLNYGRNRKLVDQTEDSVTEEQVRNLNYGRTRNLNYGRKRKLVDQTEDFVMREPVRNLNYGRNRNLNYGRNRKLVDQTEDSGTKEQVRNLNYGRARNLNYGRNRNRNLNYGRNRKLVDQTEKSVVKEKVRNLKYGRARNLNYGRNRKLVDQTEDSVMKEKVRNLNYGRARNLNYGRKRKLVDQTEDSATKEQVRNLNYGRARILNYGKRKRRHNRNRML